MQLIALQSQANLMSFAKIDVIKAIKIPWWIKIISAWCLWLKRGGLIGVSARGPSLKNIMHYAGLWREKVHDYRQVFYASSTVEASPPV
jgi:hypothetical protein